MNSSLPLLALSTVSYFHNKKASHADIYGEINVFN